ncbi:meiosis regulator and mRNA stability factor 1-like [Aphidius gifuensis]|uniref:meiosis regulator and mRNA stability factor 1-like n=1 Tax=Aphidius gifuensis TaxID=684658 RepID=UPI001CDCD1CA|nr:meiosis regulator and mRNA stability factor 1-like [Aphidius gifuensis]
MNEPKMTVKLLKDKKNRRAQENLSLDLASESETATASPVKICGVNSSSPGGSSSLPGPPHYHSSSLLVGEVLRNYWHSIPSPADTAHSNAPIIPIELLVTSLDQSIDPEIMKLILGSIFIEYIKVLNISTFVQSDGNYVASVEVPSPRDAQYAISQLHRRRIGCKRISIAYAHTSGPNYQQIISQIILLLQEVPGHKLPLFKFREMYESRFLMTLSTSDLYKMKDVCFISEDPTGRIISLNPDLRNTSSPFLENILEDEPVEFPYCTVHSQQPWINKGWPEQEIISLPNVTMSLQFLEMRIHQLLKSHNGSLPLPSVITCYEAVFHQPMNIDENGVPLEHLISCLSSVKLRQGISSVKFIEWANSEMTNDDNNNKPIMSPQLNNQLSFLSRELVDLIKTTPYCQLLFNCLIPAYHHYFGRQCRVSDYGFTKLIDLLDAIKQTVQVMGDGNRSTVTLTHSAQARRFTSDVLRILKSQASQQITLSEFPSAYEKVIGKTWNIVDYGVCQMHDILIEVSETAVVVANINDGDKLLSIPMRQLTPKEIKKIKQFSIRVIELLRHAPQYSMLIHKFIRSYYYYFGHKCRVSDYGFANLIELLEAMPDVVNIEDTNFGEKRISLTEKESWNVLKDQIVKLISNSNGSIYVSNMPQMYLYTYGYMLHPEKFNCQSVLDVLKKLNDTINLIDSQDGIKVELIVNFGIELPSSIMSPGSYHSSGDPDNDNNNNNAYNNSMSIKNKNDWNVIKLAGQVRQQKQQQHCDS